MLLLLWHAKEKVAERKAPEARHGALQAGARNSLPSNIRAHAVFIACICKTPPLNANQTKPRKITAPTQETYFLQFGDHCCGLIEFAKFSRA
jgi:hypothetical protein